ncbi:hypothetical protein [Caballeronia sp. LZ032]|uniref:hypothetical protein n=1 Tax=Caballeronia sp. LZ032 TaxID=3038565 RepID=UPI00285F7359|nr:hypothetical protein [Caballeronia sp. LZ032]MDR5883002.1 hypothetical protein [Caballeronia sp. LZ032]
MDEGDSTGDTLVPMGLDCQPGIEVCITMTDAIDPGNRVTDLALAPGSTAAGVSIEILNGADPIAFGPDSQAAGTLNQWSAGHVGALRAHGRRAGARQRSRQGDLHPVVPVANAPALAGHCFTLAPCHHRPGA